MRRSFLALLLAASLPAVQAAEYHIDPSHTYASFEIDHLGFSTQRGLFTRSSGSIEFDPEQRTGRIDIRIDAASLDTGFALRDDVLRGEDWFDSKAFPDILFRSDKLVFTGDTLSAVDGTLILRSDNPRYPDESVPPELVDEHITIIGRVRDRSGSGGL